MFFAERATLTEGLSEAIVLPAMAPLTRTADGKGDCDFDRLNISIIDVGAKDHIRSYSKILEAFLIDTRVITDRDALSGDTLKVYRARAGLVGSELEGQQIDKLRSVGVAVLSKGGLEDYYPAEAIAEVAGCEASEVGPEIEKHRIEWDEPSTFGLLEAIVRDDKEEICRTGPETVAPALLHLFDNHTT